MEGGVLCSSSVKINTDCFERYGVMSELQFSRVDSKETVLFSTLEDLRNATAGQPHKGEGEKDCFCSNKLFDLLRGSEIVEQPLPVPEPTPEQIAFRQKLVAAAEAIEYRRMTRNLDADSFDFNQLPMDVKDLKRQLSVVFNLLATLIACFMFGYYASQYAFPDLASRVLFGVVCAVVAVAAELWFLIRFTWVKESEREAKESKLKRK
eukprot:m.31023 g.31023  ORF g.31023 m.31023 type:complete len:208 (+) comp9284_c0_seq1:59-682(+)